MKIGVDVDLTVVNLVDDWLSWLNSMTGQSLTKEDCNYDYAIGDYFKEALKPFDLCPKDFWRAGHIYDLAKPIEGSIDYLKLLHKEGNEIIFISKIMGNHAESKKMFLNRYFPFHSGIVFTDEKGLVDVDVMVDDRIEFLNQFSEDVLKILIKTPYKQNIKPRHVVHERSDWREIYLHISHYSSGDKFFSRGYN